MTLTVGTADEHNAANTIDMKPDFVVVTDDPRPRGRDAVRQVMADGRPWRLQALIAEVKRRGWVRPDAINPDSSVREAVRRLARDGEAVKVEHATYKLVVPEATEQEDRESG
jgi:hypothetical protein